MSRERVNKFTSKYYTQQAVIEQLYIPAIIDSYSRIKTIPDIHNLHEPKIRNALVFDMENKNKLLKHWFDEQIIELNTEGQIIKEDAIFKTDIVFFVSGYGSFIIECKKLASAEQTYINNGIRRFTDLEYAEKDEFCGMIGFVVAGNILTTVDGLKKKVRAFNFDATAEDLLDRKCIDWETSFQSKHIRINSENIHIYHLFFSFVQPESYTQKGIN